MQRRVFILLHSQQLTVLLEGSQNTAILENMIDEANYWMQFATVKGKLLLTPVANEEPEFLNLYESGKIGETELKGKLKNWKSLESDRKQKFYISCRLNSNRLAKRFSLHADLLKDPNCMIQIVANARYVSVFREIWKIAQFICSDFLKLSLQREEPIYNIVAKIEFIRYCYFIFLGLFSIFQRFIQNFIFVGFWRGWHCIAYISRSFSTRACLFKRFKQTFSTRIFFFTFPCS